MNIKHVMSTLPSEIEEESVRVIRARIEGKRIVVDDKESFSELDSGGYGTKEGETYILRNYEALYLIYANKLKLFDESGKELNFNELAEVAQKEDPNFWTKFIIYRDLRSRGYVVREGFGFGIDLRVYDRGDYPSKPAKFVVFALDEGIETKIDSLQKSVREITKMGKEAIIAVLERRGEVIYYKVNRVHFRK